VTRGALLRGFGRCCFVAAAAVAGYLIWMLWGTGLVTAQAQGDLRSQLALMIAAQPSPAPGDADQPVRLNGDAYAEIVIPRIDLDMIVVEGTDTASLTRGPGHYPGTADPWDDTGRVAIAGHRTTYLHPFWALDKMQPGDLIRLITEYGEYDYRVTKIELVSPTATQVAEPTEHPTLILTTCNPRFSASQRLVVFADRTT
jgi:sortase A